MCTKYEQVESQELSDTPVPEKKIDEAVLQEILKETEEIDLSAIGGESDLDSLMRNILSEVSAATSVQHTLLMLLLASSQWW